MAQIALYRQMIKVTDLSFNIEDKTIFNPSSFTVKDNETCIICGESGSGKTLLVKLIAGLIPFNYGNIEIDSIDITTSNSFMKNIGMVFQNNALFDNLSAGENIAFPLQHLAKLDKKDSVKAALTLMEKLGLRGIWNKKINELSGGMQKRVAIARAIISKPKLLFLDEPTQGLDPISASKIVLLLKTIISEYAPTIVMASNDLKNLLPISQKIFVIQNKTIKIFDDAKTFYSNFHLLPESK